MRAARRSRRKPAGRCGPERPLPEPAGCEEAGAPLWVRSSLGWARSPAGPDAAGAEGAAGGRARGRGRGFPLSGDLRGAAEPRAGTAPLLSPSRGAGLSLGPWGAVGVGLVRRAAGARTPWPRTARKRRPCRLGLQSSPRPPPSPLGSLPFLAPAAALPPPSSPWLSASRSRASRGAARAGRRGGAGKGEESRPPAQHLQRAAGERAALCEGGGLAPARPERSLLFPARSLHAGTVTAAGGEDGGAAGPAVAENRGGCLTCSPRRGGCRPGTGGGGGGGAHSTRDSAAGGTN